MHYLTLEHTKFVVNNVDDLKTSPGVFIPDKIIDNFFVFNQSPNEKELYGLAALCWLPVEDIRKMFETRNRKVVKDFEDTKFRALWSQHPLYKLTVSVLQEKCKQKNCQLKVNNQHLFI